MANAGVDMYLLIDATHGATTGLTAPFDGPIVGASEPGFVIYPTTFLTTGDLTPGQSGDVGGIPAFSIEFWMRVYSYPAGSESLVVGPNAHVAVPNRQYATFLNSNGTVTFTWVNTADTTFTLTSFTAVQWGGWRHLVFTYGNNVQRIYIDGVQDNSQAASQVPNPDLIAGSADMYIFVDTPNITKQFAELAVYRYELPAARVAAHFTAGRSRGFQKQTTGARVNAVLDAAGSTAPRTIGTGVRSITPRYMTGQAPIDAVREAKSAEAVDAAFFVSKSGTMVFLDSQHRSSSPYNTAQAIFGDGAGEISYVDLTIDYSESFLTNEWNVTREGSSKDVGGTVTASDSASISKYFKRSQSLTGLPVVADSDSTSIAAAMLAKYKEPMQRITSLTFSTQDPTVAAALFARDLMDKITVKRSPPGGGARLSQDLYIQKIDITGANDGKPWTVTWSVSPL